MIDINCDVGEGLNNEHLLMPFISSCNIACGGHAGDNDTMSAVVSLASKHNVNIGAHPSYPDKKNFGRKSMQLTSEELSKTIIQQIERLEEILHGQNIPLHHIKAHGALYNDIARDEKIAEAFLKAIDSYKTKYKLLVPFGSVIAAKAQEQNFEIVLEAFADRNYNEDLSLVSRNSDKAVITDINDIIDHVSLMIKKEEVKTVSGQLVSIHASTYCVHSDTDNAEIIVKALFNQFNSTTYLGEYDLTYKSFGKSALLIEWPAEMNEDILKDILSFQSKIKANQIQGFIEAIQSIHSLTIIYNSELIQPDQLKKILETIYRKESNVIKTVHYLWKIPVCYDSNFGIDLDEISAKKSLSTEQIIALHTQNIYRVYSIGFLPGFLYLGGLDHRLQIDRRADPRLEVPKGAIGIGGSQTGIYPMSSPGGWQIIGNTPISFFEGSMDHPCFAKPGDKIQFQSISLDDYEKIRDKVLLGKYLMEKEVLDD